MENWRYFRKREAAVFDAPMLIQFIFELIRQEFPYSMFLNIYFRYDGNVKDWIEGTEDYKVSAHVLILLFVDVILYFIGVDFIIFWRSKEERNSKSNTQKENIEVPVSHNSGKQLLKKDNTDESTRMDIDEEIKTPSFRCNNSTPLLRAPIPVNKKHTLISTSIVITDEEDNTRTGKRDIFDFEEMSKRSPNHKRVGIHYHPNYESTKREKDLPLVVRKAVQNLSMGVAEKTNARNPVIPSHFRFDEPVIRKKPDDEKFLLNVPPLGERLSALYFYQFCKILMDLFLFGRSAEYGRSKY